MLEHVGELEVGGAVDDEAERALVVVLAEQRHGVIEIGVQEPRHGDQELIVEIGVLCHDGIIRPGAGRLKRLFLLD
ncbi:hypothetical protein D3C83_56710 [compost metagenome]